MNVSIDQQALYALLNTLGGISTCATACGSCKMSRESAERALALFKARTGISVDDAYYGRTVANNWRDGTIWDESGLPVGRSSL